jgi:hypothetical protein
MAITRSGRHRAPSEGNQRRLLVVLGGLLLLLLLMWVLFLRQGEPEITAGSTPPVPEQTETTAEDDATRPVPKRNDPVETFQVFAPKDPFDPLVSAAAATGASGSAPAASGAPGETTQGSSGTTTFETTGSRGDSGQDIEGHRVRVLDVFGGEGGRRLQVQVDETVYTVDVGERFARNFELLSTSGDCATMLYGDDQFTICEGEEILK